MTIITTLFVVSFVTGLWLEFCYYMMTLPATVGEGMITIKEEE
jgi:hypothetical protein